MVSKKEALVKDAYEKLIQASDDTRGAAKINLSYGQSTEFAREKFSISISLTCDQNEEKIREATQLAISTMENLVDMTTKEMFGASPG